MMAQVTLPLPASGPPPEAEIVPLDAEATLRHRRRRWNMNYYPVLGIDFSRSPSRFGREGVHRINS